MEVVTDMERLYVLHLMEKGDDVEEGALYGAMLLHTFCNKKITVTCPHCHCRSSVEVVQGVPRRRLVWDSTELSVHCPGCMC